MILQHITIQEAAENKLPIGLSACLAGQPVRYNGGHTQSRLCLDLLAPYFHFHTFCPEVAAGFSTPRPTMRLMGDPESPTLTFSKETDTDLTPQLIKGFQDKLPEMAKLDGYILMKNSPSCGMERVKVYYDNGHPNPKTSQGIFVRALKASYPLLPMEEEGRLRDDRLFVNFLVRVYAHHNFRKEVLEQPSMHHLIEFHSRYKYLLMAHHQTSYRELGRLLGESNELTLDELCQQYFALFMEALAKPANKGNHINTLLHILGYLKRSVSSSARQKLLEAIDKYKTGVVPLAVPLFLLKHYLDQHGSDYIRSQRYLEPYPEALHPIGRVESP